MLLQSQKKKRRVSALNRTTMSFSRITSAVLLLAVASLSTGCMTNDRYQYSYKKRYKRTSIGREAAQPAPAEAGTVTAPPAPAPAPVSAPAATPAPMPEAGAPGAPGATPAP
jgi:hypothetical protein